MLLECGLQVKFLGQCKNAAGLRHVGNREGVASSTGLAKNPIFVYGTYDSHKVYALLPGPLQKDFAKNTPVFRDVLGFPGKKLLTSYLAVDPLEDARVLTPVRLKPVSIERGVRGVCANSNPTVTSGTIAVLRDKKLSFFIFALPCIGVDPKKTVREAG